MPLLRGESLFTNLRVQHPEGSRVDSVDTRAITVALCEKIEFFACNEFAANNVLSRIFSFASGGQMNTARHQFLIPAGFILSIGVVISCAQKSAPPSAKA